MEDNIYFKSYAYLLWWLFAEQMSKVVVKIRAVTKGLVTRTSEVKLILVWNLTLAWIFFRLHEFFTLLHFGIFSHWVKWISLRVKEKILQLAACYSFCSAISLELVCTSMMDELNGLMLYIKCSNRSIIPISTSHWYR